VRINCVRGLATWRTKRVRAFLRHRLEVETDPAAWSQTLFAIALTEGTDAYDVFQRFLTDPKLPDDLRDDACDWLGDAIQHGQRHPMFAPCVALLIDQLAHPSAQVRWTACFSLGKARAKAALPHLSKLQTDNAWSRYGRVSTVARAAMARIRDPKKEYPEDLSEHQT
jgi:HEAT repeat protein